jgi:hypothetical protein
MTFTALEDPELHVYCRRDRAGQRVDTGGQRVRRDVPGAGTHRHQRGEVGVIHAQLIIHDGEVRQGVVTVGAGDPPELLLVDADYAERPPVQVPGLMWDLDNTLLPSGCRFHVFRRAAHRRGS